MSKKLLDIADDLVTYFSRLYFLKLKRKPVINRSKLKFALLDILKDWTQKEIESFLDYYVSTERQPDLTDFCKRYDQIIQDKQLEENDAKDRKKLMDETRQSVLKFREQYKSAERN